jgi:hypothetical protein
MGKPPATYSPTREANVIAFVDWYLTLRAEDREVHQRWLWRD